MRRTFNGWRAVIFTVPELLSALAGSPEVLTPRTRDAIAFLSERAQ